MLHISQEMEIEKSGSTWKRSHWTTEELAVHIYKSQYMQYQNIDAQYQGVPIDNETSMTREALRVSVDDLLYRDAEGADRLGSARP